MGHATDSIAGVPAFAAVSPMQPTSVITSRGAKQISHGTRYSYVKTGCPCEPCRAANLAYMRRYRKRHPARMPWPKDYIRG